jgi:signal transduction histidine kinase/CheY-like chemotaxis protein
MQPASADGLGGDPRPGTSPGRRWLARWAFGLEPETEARFRQANLPGDAARARTAISVIAAALVAWTWNDYSFIGWSARFWVVTALRGVLVAWSILLVRRLRRFESFREYDRAEFRWALSVFAFAITIGASRPHGFLAHVVVALLAVFTTCFVLTNRFPRQVGISIAITVGEAVVVFPHFENDPPALLSVILGLAMGCAVAVAGAWQLQFHRRQEFLAREALGRARDGLEAAVAQRTAELTSTLEQLEHELGERERAEAERRRMESQLIQSQRMEAVGRLAGGIAHDFNNLLTIVLSAAERLRTLLPRSLPGHEEAIDVHEAATRAATLTRQLLAFSRKQPVRPHPIEPAEALERAKSFVTRVAGERIDVTTRAAAGEGWVLIDPNQFEQILLNLSTNARDAMPEGGSLTIESGEARLDAEERLQLGLGEGRFMRLAVRDSGSGMPPDVLARVFEPFFTTKQVGHGTGLGLAAVYGITHQAGGAVRASSTLGAGSLIEVFLPRLEHGGEATGEPIPSSSSTEPLAPGPTPRTTGRMETVLVVEDEAAVRRIMVKTLKDAGYRVLEARDGEEALTAAGLERESIHLLVTDIVMPRMNGDELARRLQSARPGVCVLFVSGYPSESARALGELGPGSAYLPKPFIAGDLASAVRGLLDGRRPRESLAERDREGPRGRPHV